MSVRLCSGVAYTFIVAGREEKSIPQRSPGLLWT